METAIREALDKNYSYLFEDNLLNEIEKIGVIKDVKAGNELINIGDAITFIPLLLDGAIKIIRENENEQEIILYFIERGETCAMTTSCSVGNIKSEIRAVAERDTKLLLVPISQMTVWMSKFKTWQSFILNSYHERLMELLETVDAIAFLKMDDRLLKFLRDKAKINQNEVIKTTHQELAKDLNTSRVVVSRLLKKLENKNIIQLKRNEIIILDL